MNNNKFSKNYTGPTKGPGRGHNGNFVGGTGGLFPRQPVHQQQSRQIANGQAWGMGGQINAQPNQRHQNHGGNAGIYHGQRQQHGGMHMSQQQLGGNPRTFQVQQQQRQQQQYQQQQFHRSRMQPPRPEQSLGSSQPQQPFQHRPFQGTNQLKAVAVNKLFGPQQHDRAVALQPRAIFQPPIQQPHYNPLAQVSLHQNQRLFPPAPRPVNRLRVHGPFAPNAPSFLPPQDDAAEMNFDEYTQASQPPPPPQGQQPPPPQHQVQQPVREQVSEPRQYPSTPYIFSDLRLCEHEQSVSNPTEWVSGLFPVSIPP